MKGRRCQLCNAPATQVHHNRYLECDLTGKRTKYLAPMCDGCHFGIEFREGVKSTVAQAKSAFKKKRRSVREEFDEIAKFSKLFLHFKDDEIHTSGELRFYAEEINAE